MVKVIKKSMVAKKDEVQGARHKITKKRSKPKFQKARVYQRGAKDPQIDQGISTSQPPPKNHVASDQGGAGTVKTRGNSKMVQLKGQKSHVRLREARSYHRGTRGQLKASKKQYKKLRKLAVSQSESATAQESLSQAREELKEARLEYRAGKRVKNQTVKEVRGGSSTGDVIRRTKHLSRSQAEQAWEDNDTLDDIAQSRQKIRQVKNDVQTAKRLSRYTIKTSSKAVKAGTKGTYGIANRTYNLVRGRGFTRTATANRWEVKLKQKLKQMRLRLARTRAGRTVHQTKKVMQIAGKPIAFVLKPVASILLNPLSVSSYVMLFLILLVLSVFMSIPSTIEQDEFDLNDAWLLMSKLDREKSDEQVDYWTNIDDVLFYMNHRYGGFRLQDRWPEKTGHPIPLSEAMKDIWKQLNEDENNLKTMADLYQDDKSWLKLSKTDLADYKEALELADEVGRYVAYQDLENPFYKVEDEANYEKPLTIIDRFGYSSKTELKTSSTIQASQGQELLAAMAGTVTVDDEDVIIESQDSRLTYHHVVEKRVTSGEQIDVSEAIGRNEGSNGIEMTYEKKDDKGKWQAVNIGFYFEKVTYSQATSVLSDLDLTSEKSGRARKVASIIKKHEPKATNEGIAAVLGAWETESGLTFKRYEADDFTANQYDKVAKEPTAENLLGNWASFSKLYDNSPPAHRPNPDGYLVQGRHFIGIGIGQWTGGRAYELWKFATENKLDLWSEETQIRFLLERDTPYYREVFRKTVTGSGSTDELTSYFLTNWLGVPGNKLSERQNNAKQWLAFLNQGGSTSHLGAGDFGSLFDTTYQVSQAFGNAWAVYASGVHSGVDLVPVGDGRVDTPIYAISDGVVVKSGDAGDGYGYSIQHSMPDGRYAHYAHFKYPPKFNVGDKIKRGDQVGVMGSTGFSFAPHLHFEVLINPPYGQKLDPSYVMIERGSVTAGTVIQPRKK